MQFGVLSVDQVDCVHVHREDKLDLGIWQILVSESLPVHILLIDERLQLVREEEFESLADFDLIVIIDATVCIK